MSYKTKRFFKGVLCLIILVFCLTYLASAQTLTEKRNKVYSSLNSINQEINILKNEQKKATSKIDQNNSQIIDLNIRIEQIKQDIKQKEKEIQKKQQELKQAQKNKNKQYQNMKKRIQYIYENGQQTGLIELIFSEKDFTSFLNKIDFTQKIYQSDRELLNQFIKTIEKIQQIERELIQKKEILEKEKKGLEEQVIELQKKIKELKVRYNTLGGNIQDALRDAAALANEIAVIDREIAQKEARKQRIIENNNRLEVAPDTRSIASPAATPETSQEKKSQAKQSSTPSSNSNIVSYANQFVGNPYVWGGNSLTNGCDCSHFVWNVLKNTGHYSGGYSTSGGWANLGKHVSSIAQARAGDVIVYSGHVAIYDGNGKIVEAQSSKAGITNTRSATKKSIVAIRRFT